MQTNKPKGVAREAQSVLMRKCAPAVSWYSDALRCAGHSEGHRPKRMVAPRTVRQFAISLGSRTLVPNSLRLYRSKINTLLTSCEFLPEMRLVYFGFVPITFTRNALDSRGAIHENR